MADMLLIIMLTGEERQKESGELKEANIEVSNKGLFVNNKGQNT